MQIQPDAAAGSIEHGGKTYYFCSANCMTRFKAGSDKYTAGGKIAAAPAPRVGATYRN